MTFHPGQPNYRRDLVWTKAKDRELLSLIGSHSYQQIADAFGKSIDAVRKRASRLGYNLDQGTVTLRGLSRQTGYDRNQLRRAGRVLDQTWNRATQRKLLITQSQADELVDYLRQESLDYGEQY